MLLLCDLRKTFIDLCGWGVLHTIYIPSCCVSGALKIRGGMVSPPPPLEIHWGGKEDAISELFVVENAHESIGEKSS